MSAQANIVAFDGATTPVSHTLVPIGVSQDVTKPTRLVARWREAITTIPLNAQVTAEIQSESQGKGMLREVLQVSVPVMEAISGQNSSGYTAAPKVAYFNQYTIIENCSERATTAEKRLARQLAVNIFGGISTSVTPVVTGNVPELFDQHITPS